MDRQADKQTPSPLPRHNDLPWQLLSRFNNQLGLAQANLTLLNGTHTNIPKLRSGHVGGQVGWHPAGSTRVGTGVGRGLRDGHQDGHGGG